MTKLTLWK